MGHSYFVSITDVSHRKPSWGLMMCCPCGSKSSNKKL
jgi:hypothetical protein